MEFENGRNDTFAKETIIFLFLFLFPLMKLAPIIVFAYDRPEHLKQTLAALAKNDLASQSVLYVFCDGSREWGGELQQKTIQASNDGEYIAKRYGKMHCTKEEYDDYLQRIAKVRAVAHNQTGFKEVHVIEREKNIGLADNIVDAVTEIVNQYGRVIAFEDDIVSTRGCLTYLNDALELYKYDEQVMHISAWMYPNRGQFPTTFFYDSPYPAGGWATWARAWKYYDGDTDGHIHYWQNRWDEFEIMGGEVLRRQLYANLDGRLNTWYVKWYSSMHKVGGLCLYPHTALSNNIGWDNSGETSFETNRYYVPQPAEYIEVIRVPIKRNKKAYKYVRVWYSGHWYSKRYREKWIAKIKDVLRIK